MKQLHARYHAANVRVPVRGGYTVQFHAHKAVAPDEVAEYLVAVGGGFYSIVGDVQDALVPSASVLVIRDGGLGDVLMATPLCRKIAATGATVDFLTQERYRCLFDGNPNVQTTFALEESQYQPADYDVVLDLRLIVENSEAAGIHEHHADAFAAFGGFTLTEDERRPDVFLSPPVLDDVLQTARGIEAAVDAPLVAYVWRSSTRNRNWSQQTHQTMLEALSGAGYPVWVLDQQAQPVPTLPGVADMTGRFTLPELVAVFKMVDIAVTPDTGLFHLAAAVGTPTISYFGAFPAQERQAHQWLTVFQNWGDCALAPCRSYRCLNTDEHGQARCLSITPERIVQTVAELLSAKKDESDAHRVE